MNTDAFISVRRHRKPVLIRQCRVSVYLRCVCFSVPADRADYRRLDGFPAGSAVLGALAVLT